jgi:hypothetical protein
MSKDLKNSRLDGVIEVYSYSERRLRSVIGYTCYFVNCPVGQTLNILIHGVPVARFVVHYKRSVRSSDALERMRYKNIVCPSEIFYLHGYRPDL